MLGFVALVGLLLLLLICVGAVFSLVTLVSLCWCLFCCVIVFACGFVWWLWRLLGLDAFGCDVVFVLCLVVFCGVLTCCLLCLIVLDTSCRAFIIC